MNSRRTSFAFAAIACLVCAFSANALAQTPPPDAPPPSPPPEAPPPGWDPSMQAGGLAPPPPSSNTPPPSGEGSSTEEQLDRSKREDSGRSLEWVWLNVEGGFETVGLKTFNVDRTNFTAGFVDSTANGGVVGAGLGLRLLFLTLGARGRVGFFGAWDLFSLGGELGLHVPLGRIEPHFDLGFGYTALGSFSGAVQGATDAISIRGFDARAGAGLDIYITPALSIGANLSGELLGLTRPGVSPQDIQKIKSDPSYNPQQLQADALAVSGSSYGSALALTGVVGLHF